jgi:hypothetical protein
MIIDAIKNITNISDNEEVNLQNYMDGLNYMENLYSFLNKLKLAVDVEKISFLPSFKGKYIVEKLGLASVDKENEMKIFRVKSPLFLEDKTVLKVKKELSDMCERIERSKDVITFYLP